MRISRWLLGCTCLLFGARFVQAHSSQPASPDAVEFFESRVRPVLADSCVRCHGPQKQSSGLRLDSREAILAGGENGPAVVPGDAEKSLLVQAVRYAHEDIKMPPKGRLPDPPIQALATWVEMGAPWGKGPIASEDARAKATLKHWAFLPIRAAAPPPVNDSTWGISPIDAYVLAKLEASGMKPSPRADRRTLLRRASFDLTGLPPTAEEVAEFEADPSSDAFAKVVDRLLASPRHGERWGRHWLDVARYADTKGYVFTEERRYPFSYTYRDYVIRAFNEDLPYDRFIVEQIAADRVPHGPDNRSLAALGFLTVGRRFLNDRNEIIDDRIDVVSRGLLGLTVSCARCHDHKFDPIPSEDYYSLYGVFASSVEPAELPVLQNVIPSALAQDFEAKVQARQKAIRDYVASKNEVIQSDLRGNAGAYLKASYDLDFNPRNRRLNDRARADKLVRGRLRWVMERWKKSLEASGKSHDPLFASWHAFASIPAAEFAKRAPEVARSLASTNDPKKPVHPFLARSFAERPPATMKDVVARYADFLDEVESHWQERLKGGPSQKLAEPEWEQVRQWLYSDASPITLRKDTSPGPFTQFSEEMGRLLDLQDRLAFTKLTNQLAELTATHPGAPARAMVVNDVPQPIEPHVFVRGNPGRPGKQVPRRFLKLLSEPDRKPFADGSGRLDLARAIASASNPLTARVLVNRVWLNHFGAGLVATPSDFGLRSDPPSHPELLDDLAAEFIKSGWSIKALHRRIMLSSTYQQRSDNNPAYLDRDPQNRLLWKFNRRRLDFEAMRDALLSVSGRLDVSVGGRPVGINEPPFPPRRTVYGFIDRQNLDGVFRTFDFASPDASSPRRFVTTVPQQALFLMNSPFVVAQARSLAAQAEAASTDPQIKIQALYRRVYGRNPVPGESALGERFIRNQTELRLPANAWRFGRGELNDVGRVTSFAPFVHGSKGGWHPALQFPDPEHGNSHLKISASGGHAGPDAQHAAVRRWTAPHDGVISIEGALSHDQNRGDGVRGRIVTGRTGVLGEWLSFNGKVPTNVTRYEVKRGEVIDFAVDCRGGDSFDSFTWAPVIRCLEPSPATWNAAAEFTAPAPDRLSPWEEYAQVLLLTNEFMFVD